jgi:hypothetical protein
MILSAISMQESAEHGRLVQTSITNLLAPHYDQKKLQQILKEMLGELWKMHRISQLDRRELYRKRPGGSIDGIVKIYHALEKSTFFDMIREEHYRINPKERPHA